MPPKLEHCVVANDGADVQSIAEGTGDGSGVGMLEGVCGAPVGNAVGSEVGLGVGNAVGMADGIDVGTFSNPALGDLDNDGTRKPRPSTEKLRLQVQAWRLLPRA